MLVIMTNSLLGLLVAQTQSDISISVMGRVSSY